ncbi:hypothetical protein [Neorhizobium petrolearium]|uniref:Lipoprotein n=1 Tax=Neorhizobium petrolearium TaxID=515361 RepID=A0ABY8LZL7_9HYPH|nr:hypothetical protein [Neorhizobium petrolearium]MCC2612642.1 hypothetical protein [Neorhizobium petrolearium]WGI67765.1 hypothetical protein QEO92_22710 [Neorhizobium petrolearium]
MRNILLVAVIFLAGCASKELIAKSAEYGSAHEIVKTQYGEFRVYEHPTGKRLAVSSTLAGAMGQGIAKGLTFGAGNVLPSEGAYQEAAEQYLAKHKALSSCKITNGYLLQEPIFEFTIRC